MGARLSHERQHERAGYWEQKHLDDIEKLKELITALESHVALVDEYKLVMELQLARAQLELDRLSGWGV